VVPRATALKAIEARLDDFDAVAEYLDPPRLFEEGAVCEQCVAHLFHCLLRSQTMSVIALLWLTRWLRLFARPMQERLILFLEQLGEIGILTRDFFKYLLRPPFEARALIEQLDSVGYRSLNVVNLTAIFSGMVLALQMGQFLEKFGAKIYVSRIMGLSLLREMGPVLAALMIAARVGAGFSAELGTMKVTEQIDAMRALGTSPIKKLVVPRVLATIIMMPILAALA